MPDFPRVTATVDPATIWAYATRTLTHIIGDPRTDLIGANESLDTHGYTSVRAGYLDHLDADISGVADAVWAVTTRELTGITGTPRSDLLGENATFEAGTGARKAVLDKLLALQTPSEGTLSYSTGETIVVEKTDTLEFNLDGYIDLSNMASGDTYVIRQYMKIKSGGAYIKYAEESYSDAQSSALLAIMTKPSRYALKITIEKTAGTNRDFDYQFYQRKRTA